MFNNSFREPRNGFSESQEDDRLVGIQDIIRLVQSQDSFLRSDSRGIDFGLGRGYSGSQVLLL